MERLAGVVATLKAPRSRPGSRLQKPGRNDARLLYRLADELQDHRKSVFCGDRLKRAGLGPHVPQRRQPNSHIMPTLPRAVSFDVPGGCFLVIILARREAHITGGEGSAVCFFTDTFAPDQMKYLLLFLDDTKQLCL